MILSEELRRWYEVQFYEICQNIYEIRKRTIDILDFAELICSLGNIEFYSIKVIIQSMFNDPYYKPSRGELILLAMKFGITASELAERYDRTRQNMNQIRRRYEEAGSPTPLLSIDKDQLIIKFIETYKKVQKAGL